MRLAVNVDHVATLRQVRKTEEPDPIQAALLAELAGADGIIVHLREDRRHIQERDVKLLKELVKTKLNLEMAPTDAMVKFALSIKPDLVTLVPERREELTTEGGLMVSQQKELIIAVVSLLQEHGISVSLFVEPDQDQIKAAHKTKAKMVELHTGTYANAKSEIVKEKELQRLKDAAILANKLGLRLSAGHGLNYQNVEPILALPHIEELNIGHSIVARAVLVGFYQAVKEMIEIIKR